MKLIKISSKSLSPKRLFRSKKDRSAVSRRSSDPLSFESGTASSSSSSSSDSLHKPGTGAEAGGIGTPTSVLPERSGDWSDFSTDLQLDMAQAFKLIDRDNDGVVSIKELEALLSRLGADPPSQEEVMLMLSEVDREGNGSISLEALLKRVGPVCGPAADSELRDAFEVFDSDHDGKISAEELLNVFTAIGDDRCTLEDCRRMIAGVDKNGDGFVCFEDFARMMELQR
ncbi:PREDICTED: probable calcium-binding [Prunus dulcis]|uniref:PREDICTED: probable calcium-binding n=1 Tax=Prunus dulcis TaxID=3755 RepID=A0A5E4FEC7_PRUDU|nr:probable calcium-binding protein CML36 [Prunus dulcis]VVA23958.1 PREDICTED: probable calcium-binding [Prunus dulcis]